MAERPHIAVSEPKGKAISKPERRPKISPNSST
jgi:hypothetical protein